MDIKIKNNKKIEFVDEKSKNVVFLGPQSFVTGIFNKDVFVKATQGMRRKISRWTGKVIQIGNLQLIYTNIKTKSAIRGINIDHLVLVNVTEMDFVDLMEFVGKYILPRMRPHIKGTTNISYLNISGD